MVAKNLSSKRKLRKVFKSSTKNTNVNNRKSKHENFNFIRKKIQKMKLNKKNSSNALLEALFHSFHVESMFIKANKLVRVDGWGGGE